MAKRPGPLLALTCARRSAQAGTCQTPTASEVVPFGSKEQVPGRVVMMCDYSWNHSHTHECRVDELALWICGSGYVSAMGRHEIWGEGYIGHAHKWPYGARSSCGLPED
jgi:hypothetical protein